MQNYNICIIFKKVRYKLYNNIESLSLPIYWWRNPFINFIISFLMLTNLKNKFYNLILIIIN